MFSEIMYKEHSNLSLTSFLSNGNLSPTSLLNIFPLSPHVQSVAIHVRSDDMGEFIVLNIQNTAHNQNNFISK